MIPLYTKTDFQNAKSNTKLPLKCEQCGNTFYKLKKIINLKITEHLNDFNSYKNTCRFCSYDCLNLNKITKEKVTCLGCNIIFEKLKCQIKKSPKHFCSHSCSATYNNKNKITGTRRSKLEIWLESQLPMLYPNLEFHFNKKDAIGSELDIYIPALSLAFELNGIFHYEPIYGQEKLGQIQENDQNKFKFCSEKNISLCIIDTSQQKYFKESNSKKYLDIITNIINERLLTS